MARRESLVEKKRRADERKALCDELSSAIKVVSKRREREGEFRYNIYIYILFSLSLLCRSKKIM